MKKDVIKFADGKPTNKKPSKETLNHAGIIKYVTGKDPYFETEEAFYLAYKKLGIDIINRVPEVNAPTPCKDGEVVDLGNGYKKTSLGVYDTVARHEYPFKDVDEFFKLKNINPRYEDLITPVPHELDLSEIKRKEKVIGDIGIYYYQLYTTLFMWGVEYLGWEVYMLAAALDPDLLKSKFLDVVFENSKKLIKTLTKTTSPFVFCHDDLADKNGPILSPSWYEKYIFPYYPELWKIIHKENKKVIFVADGNMEQFIDPLIGSGIDGVMFESPATDFDVILNKMEGKIVIGGIDTSLLTFGTPKQIEKHVREVHEKTKDFPGFAISTPGGIHGNIPLKNLMTYFQIRAELGYTPENWNQKDSVE